MRESDLAPNAEADQDSLENTSFQALAMENVRLRKQNCVSRGFRAVLWRRIGDWRICVRGDYGD